jgi:phospholipase C
VNQSKGTADALTGSDACGNGNNNSLPGVGPANLHALGRCGYGPRLPLLVISPYARPNFVDPSLSDQTSILRFIEDNWLGGQRLGAGSFDAIAGSLETCSTLPRHPTRRCSLTPAPANQNNGHPNHLAGAPLADAYLLGFSRSIALGLAP